MTIDDTSNTTKQGILSTLTVERLYLNDRWHEYSADFQSRYTIEGTVIIGTVTWDKGASSREITIRESTPNSADNQHGWKIGGKYLIFLPKDFLQDNYRVIDSALVELLGKASN